MGKIAILIDEMSMMHQLHKIGVEGVNPWISFYETVQEYYTNSKEAEYFFYANNVPKEWDEERFMKRERFFNALKQKEIHVRNGFSVIDSEKKIVSKGLDVLMAMDMMDLERAGYQELIIATSNSSIIPMINRLKDQGVNIRVIVGESTPAGKLKSSVGSLLFLEDVLGYLPTKNLKWRKESVVA